jgi:hypothetical protein
MTKITVILLAAAVAACSEAGGEQAPGELLSPPPAGQGVQVRLEQRVSAGDEIVVCREFVVDTPMEVGRLEHAYAAGGHHILAYRLDAPTAGQGSEPFACGEIAGPLIYENAIQRGEARFPAGVGLRLAPGDVIRVELHYPNASTRTADAGAALNLWTASQPLAAEAGNLFFYHRDIVVPAHGRATAKLRCEIPEAIDILSLAPHTHRLGTRFSARVVDEVSSRSLLETTAYGDLERREFDEPVHVSAGQTIEVECDYENDGDVPIIEGPSKTGNEMCLLLGDYFPRLQPAAEWCTLDGSGAVHDGSLTCAEVLARSQSDDELVAEQSFVDVCAASSPLLANLTNCGFNRCNAECVFGGPDCVPCVAERCPDYLSACMAGGC